MQQNSNTDHIGAIIHYYRLIRKMTQEQLGESAGCSQVLLARLSEVSVCPPYIFYAKLFKF